MILLWELAGPIPYKAKGFKMSGTSSGHKSKRGRPKAPQETARSNRIVTFVTDRELMLLESVTIREDRSVASVVDRIIKAHLEGQD